MSSKLLLCTDLDGTLIPNGDAPESEGARRLFARFASRPEVTLVYLTGRDQALIESAIMEWDLPRPAHLVGDVGASILDRHGSAWISDRAWRRQLAESWKGRVSKELLPLLEPLAGLELQESERQADFKLSFYCDAARSELAGDVESCLRAGGVPARAVFSVDERQGLGLLDVLPPAAGKLAALEYLMRRGAYSQQQVIFAGDSGNDLDVLASSIPSVLVANAAPKLRALALVRARSAGNEEALLIARGGFAGMNGNYAAGILEGIAHYWPECSILQ